MMKGINQSFWNNIDVPFDRSKCACIMPKLKLGIMFVMLDVSGYSPSPPYMQMKMAFKGTMSHKLQAKKMKKLNSNCIWKIILI